MKITFTAPGYNCFSFRMISYHFSDSEFSPVGNEWKQIYSTLSISPYQAQPIINSSFNQCTAIHRYAFLPLIAQTDCSAMASSSSRTDHLFQLKLIQFAFPRSRRKASAEASPFSSVQGSQHRRALTLRLVQNCSSIAIRPSFHISRVIGTNFPFLLSTASCDNNSTIGEVSTREWQNTRLSWLRFES